MTDRVTRILLQPEEGIFVDLLLGIPAEVDSRSKVEELITRVPELQALVDKAVAMARQQMEKEGLSEYVMVGRYGVPAIIKGMATHRGNVESLEDGETGMITAYLPEQNTFAIWFKEGKWLTFQDWTEEQFHEQFEALIVIKEEEDEPGNQENPDQGV